MSFLFPAFLLAALLVAVPLLLHLARRRTRREQPWSSLLFLRPHPPRLERRRRVEHWLLLFLRAAAFVLLALAFARPFLTRPLPLLAAASGQRTLVLVDVSASMRREGFREQALSRVQELADQAVAGDRVGVLAFDEQVRTVLSFEQWAAAPPTERRALLASRLAPLRPGHRATDLGVALVAAGDALLDDQSAAGGVAMASSTVVLVSDLQEGSRLTELSASDWPAGVKLRVVPIGEGLGDSGASANLSMQALAAAAVPADGGAERPRVRVVASRESDGASVRGTLRWKDGAGSRTEVTLAPGESRSLDAPARPVGHGTLVLTGDRSAFDNELHLAPPVPTPARILYVGDDVSRSTEPGPLFFLQKAFPVTRSRAPRVEAFAPADPAFGPALAGADLVVATAAPAAGSRAALERYLQEGRLLVLAPGNAESGAALGDLLVGKNLAFREAPAGREAVLTEVDLGHPILLPFADGQAADFTKIRFWKRRLLDLQQLPGARALGRFDDGSPALVLAPSGRGQLFLFTSGWDLADSQLALSSKLVPLLWMLLETSAGLASDRSQFFVAERIPLPTEGAGIVRRVFGPDGREIPLPRQATFLAGVEEPGLYTLLLEKTASGRGQTTERRPFAVNLRPAESATAPLPLERLERLGVRLENGAAAAGRPAKAAENASAASTTSAAELARRAAFEGELERQQRPWRFVLLVVFLVLCLETWLAGRRARSSAAAPALSQEAA